MHKEKNKLIALIEQEDKIVTVSHAREYFGGCIPGWQGFAASHGFEWIQVVRHGLKASELLATNDAMAINLVNYVYTGEK